MSTFSTFAVAGAGNIGSLIAESLLKYKASGQIKEVIVLTRSDTHSANLSALVSQGATIIPIDYTSVNTLTTSLAPHKIDVLASAFSHPTDMAESLADAAKAVGVKLFVPAEYGDPSTDLKEPLGFMVDKLSMQKRLRELGLPYALFFTGLWPEFNLNPFLEIDFEAGKARIGGDGNMPLSWTSKYDIASFAAYVLTMLPPSKLEWQTFRIEGERLSFNQIFEAFENKTGKKIDVTHISIEELKETVKKDPFANISSHLHLMGAVGEALVGTPEQLSNGLFPAWNPRTVISTIAP